MRLRTLFLLLPAWLPSIAPAAEVRDYPAERVAAHTWVIHGPLGDPSVENQGFMNNPAFVVTREGVVVIDPGSSVQAGRMVLRQIRRITRRPVTHVLNTHVHGDHWLGNHAIHDAFPDAKILAHPEMIRAAREGEGDRWLEIMDRLTQGFTQETRAVIPSIPVVEDQTFSAGGVTFRILAPPKAHSGTDIMIHVAGEGVLFLGDNVMNARVGAIRGDGTFLGNIAACDRALKESVRVFVPGHGKSGGGDIVRAYRAYLSTLFEAVRREVDAGKRDYEMKEAVRAQLAPYRHWTGFDIHLGRQISSAVIEAEAF